MKEILKKLIKFLCYEIIGIDSFFAFKYNHHIARM